MEVRTSRKTAIFTATSALALVWSAAAHASENRVAGFETTDSFFRFLSGTQSLISKMAGQSTDLLLSDAKFVGASGASTYAPRKVSADEFSTTLKYKQFYQGVEVMGGEAMFHYDSTGNLLDTTGGAVQTLISATPQISEAEIIKILDDRFQTSNKVKSIALKVITDNANTTRLVYQAIIKNNANPHGYEMIVDANTGAIVFEIERMCEVLKRTVYSADTEAARDNTDPSGAPTGINMDWYEEVLKDKATKPDLAKDASATRAYNNSKKVYDYYKKTHARLSYDGNDARMVSLVHMGKDWNNAFWTSEYEIMAYGDGDGKKFIDLTKGLDVAGHEVTHAVTSNEANLTYAAESGALNEHFSDFFGKMVDRKSGHWYIGADIIGKELKAKGVKSLRNMINPEENKQPGSNDSPYRKPTTGMCNRMNDNCGVHTNSGIPNRASALIADAIGMEKTEKLYYNVLTQRLTSSSDFAAMVKNTNAACKTLYGAGSAECKAVEEAFQTVKM